MAMTASDAAARVRLGKPNNFDATAMMVETLARKRDSREVEQVVECLVLIRSNDGFGICTNQSVSLGRLPWEM